MNKARSILSAVINRQIANGSPIIEEANCTLSGIFGDKPAICRPIEGDAPCHVIVSTDKTIRISVGKKIVAARFSESQTPTFFYS